jgi:hypothetical protein
MDVSVQEAAALIHRSTRQIQRYIDAQVFTGQHKDDIGRWRIPIADLQKIDHLDQVELERLISERGITLADIMTKLDDLERRVQSIEAAKRPVHQSIPIVNTSKEPRTSRPRAMDNGLISYRVAAHIAVSHGANSETSAKDWFVDFDTGRAALKEGLQQTIRYIFNYLDMHPRAGTWQQCTDETCPCRSLG